MFETIPSQYARVVDEMIKTQFYLPKEVIANNLAKHYLLHWSAGYLREQILASSVSTLETITHQDVKYKIVFNVGDSAYKLVLSAADVQYKLSFRFKKGLDPKTRHGYVIIKKLSEVKS